MTHSEDIKELFIQFSGNSQRRRPYQEIAREDQLDAAENRWSFFSSTHIDAHIVIPPARTTDKFTLPLFPSGIDITPLPLLEPQAITASKYAPNNQAKPSSKHKFIRHIRHWFRNPKHRALPITASILNKMGYL